MNIDAKYRVVGIVESMGFKPDYTIMTPWFNNYDEAKRAKKLLEVEQEKNIKKGYGYFIGYYKIETQQVVAKYID